MNEKKSWQRAARAIGVGAFVGLGISFFRWAIPQALNVSAQLLAWERRGLLQAGAVVACFVLVGCAVAWCVRREPLIGGSGIPQVRGKLQGTLRFSWRSMFLYKLLGGLGAIGAGLTLGREGPSVQLGAALAQGMGEECRCAAKEQDALLVAGASAGLAVAFYAPVSGLLFAVEELRKKTSTSDFLCSGLVIVTATLVSVFFFGQTPAISVPALSPLSSHEFFWLLPLGLLVGLSGALFTRMILWSKTLYGRWQVPEGVKCLLPFVVSAPILLLDARLLGSGESLITLPMRTALSLATLVYFYGLKLFLVSLSFGSGIPGGIFFPLLALGALVGQILGTGLEQGGLVGPSMVFTLSILAMAAHFSAIVRAPLTGICLIFEMTGGSLDQLLPLLVVSYVAYLVAEALHVPPIYDALLDRLPNNTSPAHAEMTKNPS